jgi:hypothetical protein
MDLFPSIDPIPLPAPVWLLKLLHIVTLILHFTTVQMLIGGLLVAIVLSLAPRGSTHRGTAGALAGRLPVVMTYVINFGVPPLLFAQVLYGRALYTSSVLMGAWWIAVIPLLIACYWLLYRFADRVRTGKSAWWIGALAWLLAGSIAKIYTSNMTLMLRPEAWHAMYSASATGASLPSGDPTMMFRWLFMLTGGLVVAGMWMLWLSGRRTFDAPQKTGLMTLGGRIAVVGALIQLPLAIQVVSTQPAAVQTALRGSALYQTAANLWLAAIALAILVGLWYGFVRRAPGLAPIVGILTAALTVSGTVLYRDGIRDLTLLSKGLNVWQTRVVTNWPVVGLFLVLFVGGLAAAGWLISVVARAKNVMEKTA